MSILKRVAFVTLACWVLCTAQRVYGALVINEIMYHPASENEDEEYIEIHNSGAVPIDLSGWTLGGGVDYAFAAGVNVSEGGYLVVANSPAQFASRYPSVPAAVVGGYSGRLGNGGDTVRLINPSGQDIDRVTYEDGGLWPAAADGDGPSLETRHPGLDNAWPQSWAAGVVGGTPGAVNSAFDPDPPPTVTGLRHEPLVPDPDDPMRVTCHVIDETPPAEVRLVYGAGGGGQSGAVETLISEGDLWRFFRGRSEPATGTLVWTGTSFQDASWETGATGIGYGDGDDQTVLSDMENNYLSVYLRKRFDVAAPTELTGLYLEIDWDDGFIAYLNGAEIARRQMGQPGEFFAYNQPTTNSREAAAGGGPGPETIDISSAIPSLIDGPNVLAIQCHNRVLISSDLSIIPELSADRLAPTSRTALKSFSSLMMFDDGAHGDGEAADGIYGAFIPPQPRDAIIDFYVEARDTGGALAVSPLSAPSANALIQVDGTTHPSNLPLYRVVMSEADLQELHTRDVLSNVLLNATFIAGDAAYYNKGIRLRGNNARNMLPRSYRIDFPSYDAFDGVTEINLNGSNITNQVMGWDFLERFGGSPPPEWQLVNLVLNNTFTPNHLQIESIDGPYIEAHLGETEAGNLYRGVGNAALDYRGPLPDPYRLDYFKKTNAQEDDFSDIAELSLVFDLATDAVFPTLISKVIDVDQWMRFFAFHNVLGNLEGGIYLDAGDDYFLYHRDYDDRFMILPWDLDSTYSDAGQDVFRQNVDAVRRLVRNPTFVRLYYAAIGDALDDPFTLPSMRRAIDRWRGILPAGRLNEIEQFVIQRRNTLLDRIPWQLTVDEIGEASIGDGPEVSIFEGSQWRFFRGRSEPSGGTLAWTQSQFPDSDWEEGPSGFGYGDGDDNTVLSDMQNDYLSVYLRKKFSLPSVEGISQLTFTIDWDDGFIAYLNGEEIARRQMGSAGEFFAFDQTTTDAREAGTPVTIDLGSSIFLLRAGVNALAVQGHNRGLDSSDSTFIPELYSTADRPLSCRRYTAAASGVPLKGRAHAGDTAAVWIDGEPVFWDPVAASWEGEVNLEPGLNQFNIQSVDANGRPVESLTVPIYRADSVEFLSGQLEGDHRWTKEGGPYVIGDTLTVPAGASLSIDPGVAVLFGPNARMEVMGSLVAEGTAQAPIWFVPYDCTPWDRILITSAVGPVRFTHCEFRDSLAGEGSFFSGTLTIQDSTVAVDRCVFRDCNQAVEVANNGSLSFTHSEIHGAREGIHSSSSHCTIESSMILNTQRGDAIDFDGNSDPVSRVVGCTLSGGLDDGIDTFSSDILVEDNVLAGFNANDGKAISLEGPSSPMIRNNVIYDNFQGILIKDSCSPFLVHNTIVDNFRGIRSFEKNPGRGPGGGFMTSSIIWGNGMAIVLESGSTLDVRFSDVEGSVTGEGNIDAPPRFIDPSGRDYRLRPLSPCIGAGFSQTDMGALPAGTGGLAGDFTTLRITELMYHPIEGEEYEFVELWNAGNQWLDLSGLWFSDGIEFTFSAGTSLAPGEYLVVVADLEAFELKYGGGRNVTGQYTGKLNNDGERIALSDDQGSEILAFVYNDAGDWPKRPDGGGSSLELVEPVVDLNDPAQWRASAEFGGTPGGRGLGPAGGVVINEVLTHGDLPLEDAIEIYNPTDQTIDLGGWFLSDDSVARRKYRLPQGLFLSPFAYTVFYEHDFMESNPLEPFSLHPAGGGLCLTAGGLTGKITRFMDETVFGGAFSGMSNGRHQTSVGVDFVPMEGLTFGAVVHDTPEEFRQGMGAPNGPPRVGPVVINEIMYHPIDTTMDPPIGEGTIEYLELHNLTDAPVDLYDLANGNPWMLSGGVDFTFPVGASVPAAGYLLVVGFNPATDLTALAQFRAIYPMSEAVGILGPWIGRLRNVGELLQLHQPDGPFVDGSVPMVLTDQVQYGDDQPWPAQPDGQGPSLERIDSSTYGNEPENWGVGMVGGSPGGENVIQNKTRPQWRLYSLAIEGESPGTPRSVLPRRYARRVSSRSRNPLISGPPVNFPGASAEPPAGSTR